MTNVQTSGPRPRHRPRPADPATDLRLARLHLRMGHLGLARAELEALAGSTDLRDEGLLALAEARWRTGDLPGAGEAAQAYLADGGEALVALVIAAEATAGVGRPGEARRLAGRALERADLPLDRIFAGMPRSGIWPVEPSEARPAQTLFPGDGSRASVATGVAVTGAAATAGAPALSGPGLWDTDAVDAPSVPVVDPATELSAALASLDAGERGAAAVRLAIVLRLAPTLAPVVLDAVSRAGRSAELELVRGDALRLVGREIDAQHAFAAAAALLSPGAGDVAGEPVAREPEPPVG